MYIVFTKKSYGRVRYVLLPFVIVQLILFMCIAAIMLILNSNWPNNSFFGCKNLMNVFTVTNNLLAIMSAKCILRIKELYNSDVHSDIQGSRFVFSGLNSFIHKKFIFQKC